MKNILIAFALLFCYITINSQAQTEKIDSPVRSIEVIGSSEMEVEPDEIILVIELKEYWKEEFDKNAKFKDYKTKIEINDIERDFFNEFLKIGISKDRFIITDIGNSWRLRGKEILMSKTYKLSLSDMKKVDEILDKINIKGVEQLRIEELKNKNISQFRKQVKIEALKAAKEKATYLLEGIGNKIGSPIAISELDNDNGNVWPQRNILSNSLMSSETESGITNIRKIKLRYEIKAKFEIK